MKMIFSWDENLRCDGNCLRFGLRRQVAAHFRFLPPTVRLRSLCVAFMTPISMTTGVLRPALISAMANDACPGLMGEKQQ
jgi:hypothetical protein